MTIPSSGCHGQCYFGIFTGLLGVWEQTQGRNEARSQAQEGTKDPGT